jgi:Rrf2 family protein
MRISAKSDYAIRAAVYIATADGRRVKAEELATETRVPRQFLENILGELRRAGIVRAQRGAEGGYALARPAADINIAMVLAAVGSPLSEEDDDLAASRVLVVAEVWRALQQTTRTLLESVTLDDLVRGELPKQVRLLAQDDGPR